MIKKLQSFKGKTKLKSCQIISNYYDEMKYKNYQFEEDPTSKNAGGSIESYHEVLLL